MIRFTFRQLSYFVAAAETGSTLKAAQRLSVSQPAVSVAISQLEELFEQKLFIRRHSQGMELTLYGQRKLVAARHLLAQANAFGQLDIDGAVSGALEIGVFSTLAPAFAPGLLAAFAKAHPGVRVTMREEDLDGVKKSLMSGRVELALLYELESSDELTRIPLADFHPYALLPAGHPLAAQDKVSLRDLAKETFLLIDLPQSRDYFISLFRQVDAMPAKVLPCTSIETLRGMVANNFGVSVLVTRPPCNISNDGMPLVSRTLREAVPPQRAIIATSANVLPTPAAQAFIEVAKTWLPARAHELATVQPLAYAMAAE
ncbi:LysR family transcriptional regulator [Acuticoccus mangrovi]|uniref:LysR family transcriptional regulator n=1 Tax=Acuticoccus mangrovi TaxID=2796142 RepID=A0A934IMX6_9HYPH|nr:LysR family transcriptional regulator [Acuticoccus mangrovi]MBJ3777856.1 LysR family transcriptional regulator [Acuticoccus mangrovi]